MIRLTAVIEVEGQAAKAVTHQSNARAIILGRDQSADFQIPLSTVSRHHARISQSDNLYFIEDLGSTHGTVLAGRKLPQGEKKVLRDGDIIEITKAKITCAIESEKVATGEPGEGTQSIAVKAVQGILGRLGESQAEGPFLRIVSGPGEGKRLDLVGMASEWALGRSKDCELVIDDPNISRRHALIKKDWHGFLIQDLGSRNGVVLNDHKIQKPRRLKDQDEVVIGPVKLIFIDPDAELLAALKDVPGFEIEDSVKEDPTTEPSVVGAPQEEAKAEEAPAPELPAEEKPKEEFTPEDISKIDPELLKGTKSKFPLEWLIIGVVGVFVLALIGFVLILLS